VPRAHVPKATSQVSTCQNRSCQQLPNAWDLTPNAGRMRDMPKRDFPA
jgi:hypothetical protein